MIIFTLKLDLVARYIDDISLVRRDWNSTQYKMHFIVAQNGKSSVVVCSIHTFTTGL